MRFNLSWKFSRLICLGVVSLLSISSTGWSLEDAAAITRIKSAIADKDLATAVKEVRKLPMDQRMAWVDALSKLQSSKFLSARRRAKTTPRLREIADREVRTLAILKGMRVVAPWRISPP